VFLVAITGSQRRCSLVFGIETLQTASKVHRIAPMAGLTQSRAGALDIAEDGHADPRRRTSTRHREQGDSRRTRARSSADKVGDAGCAERTAAALDDGRQRVSSDHSCGVLTLS